MVKNPLTQNVALVEIKKSHTSLVGSVYRSHRHHIGEVWPPHREIIGGCVQVLDQANQLKTQFQNIASMSGHPELKSWSIDCYVIAGRLSSLPPDRQMSFELYRASLHGVRVVTFDEVLEQLRGLRTFLSH